MKRRVAEMEAEAAKLREMLHKVTPNRDAHADFKGDFDDPQG